MHTLHPHIPLPSHLIPLLLLPKKHKGKKQGMEDREDTGTTPLAPLPPPRNKTNDRGGKKESR